MVDSESQDSSDDSFFLVNMDPKTKTSIAYENIMQEVIRESQEGNVTPVGNSDDHVNNDPVLSPINDGCFEFSNIFYLGHKFINKPNDPVEVNEIICEFSKNCKELVAVKLCIPFNNGNSVKMTDASTDKIITEFPICRIGFCTGGHVNHYPDYLAFSYLQTSKSSEKESDNNLQCYVYKLSNLYQLERILDCFHKSFETCNTDISLHLSTVKAFAKTHNAKFKVTIDIKEDDGKGNFVSVPREDAQIFKLKSNITKKVVVQIEQINGPISLQITRCVGLFIGAGRYLSDIDMTLLEMDSLGQNDFKNNVYCVSGDWDPSRIGFELLNNTREKIDQTIYMTIGVNLCIENVEAPLCLKIACKAKIFPENHRFWISLKKMTVLHLMLLLEEKVDEEKCMVNTNNFVVKTIQYIWPDNIFTIDIQPDHEPSISESVESDEEPVKSGSGNVSKEITDEQLMSRWGALLSEWQADVSSQPKNVSSLVKHGVPEALRGEVWQLMTGSVSKETELQDVYRILITKETKFDPVIKRDMPRTFTAHPMFLQKDGPGQEALFRVCKAYASYDEEVGYCQGTAFLAASLIVHMPEEQVFVLLVTIMHKYRVRDMYSKNFEGLHICLYQLDNLLADKMNDLYLHFQEMHLESHMYANQWFMTLFTMKFHLYAVFHILDLFLLEGIVVIFKVALALLKLSRKELLTMDFEGALNYFRISLPKLYRNEDACKDLIKTALKIKISNKKLQILEKEWRKIQEVRAETEDPLEIVQRDLKHTKNEYNRLDQENDSLAKELITSKICLQKNIDKLEENLEVVNKELFMTRKDLVESQEQIYQLQAELKQVKDKFREEMQLREDKSKKQEKIIQEYKRITSQLNERVEKAEMELDELNEESNSSSNVANTTESATVNDSETGHTTGTIRNKRIPQRKLISHLENIISACPNCKEKAMDGSAINGDDKIYDAECKEKGTIVGETEDDDDSIICLTRAKYRQQKDQIAETELALANTKLSLVESHCQQQKMLHELSIMQAHIADCQQNHVQQTSKPFILGSNALTGSSSLMKKLWNRTISGSGGDQHSRSPRGSVPNHMTRSFSGFQSTSESSADNFECDPTSCSPLQQQYTLSLPTSAVLNQQTSQESNN